MEQKREPRNKSTHLWSIDLWRLLEICKFLVNFVSAETLPTWPKKDRVQNEKAYYVYIRPTKFYQYSAANMCYISWGKKDWSSVESRATENYSQTWKPKGVCLGPVTSFFLLWTRMSVIVIIRLSHHIMEQWLVSSVS